MTSSSYWVVGDTLHTHAHSEGVARKQLKILIFMSGVLIRSGVHGVK